MAKNPHQLMLRKLVFSANYKPSLGLYERLYSATAKLTGYEHWETNRLYVFLHDYVKRCVLAVQHNNLSYEWDYGGTDKYMSDIKEALKILPDSLGIEKFTRLGFRQQFLIPVDMEPKQISTILDLKFLVQDKQLTDKIFPSGIDDMSYVVIGADNELGVRVSLGPMKQEEISQHIQINQKYNFDATKPDQYARVITSYPATSIFLDIDISRKDDDIQTPYAIEFLEKAEIKLRQTANTLKEYIFLE